MELTSVTEGATQFRVPRARAAERQGPAKRGPGFYNPAMALTRDVGVLVAGARCPPGEPVYLDGLSATGARGLRIANEAPGWHVELNDDDPRALEVLRTNAATFDGVSAVHGEPFNALVTGRRWHAVDVDPYGSPVPYLASACRAVRRDGLLAITATDTSALHGARPNVCRRRYLAEPPPRRSPGWKVAAHRVLVGHAVRTAAQFDVALTPLLVHEHQHAVRAYLGVRRGATVADHALTHVRPMALCPACQHWGEAACSCGRAMPSGPYYVGRLHDGDLIAAMAKRVASHDLAHGERVARLLDQLADEARLGPFYLDVDEACRSLGASPPRTQRLVEALADAGIEAARTHAVPKAVAYAGPAADAMAVLEGLTS